MSRPPAHLVTANLFGIPFSLAALAQCWSTAHTLVGVPGWPSRLLWVVTALVYAVLLVAYLRNVLATGRTRTETSHPVFGPFTALVGIVPMLLALGLAGVAPRTGTALFLVLATLVVLYGAWLTGQWISRAVPLERWHPAYFLPAVAGPLLGAAGSAALHLDRLALVLFGYGLVCWLTVGSIILARLVTLPALPTPLVPTLAIELAPPVVAGSAWFTINGNRPDTVAYLLAGYAVLMALVQLRLIPLYAKVPFVAGIWAFAFSYVAGFTFAVRWLAAEQVRGAQALSYGLLALVTAAIVALGARTAVALRRGTFLARAPATAPAALEPAAV